MHYSLKIRRSAGPFEDFPSHGHTVQEILPMRDPGHILLKPKN